MRGNTIITLEEDEHMLGKIDEASNINVLQQYNKDQITEMVNLYKQSKIAQSSNA